MGEALSEAEDMIQPGILLIGQEYLIKVNDLYMHLPNANFVSALCYMMAFYFVLDISYPLPLKFVFLYLESMFEMPLTIKSVTVDRLLTHLDCLNQ